MNIQGLQKLTLLDYPDHMACTIFTGGCNFRCPFCHNMNLVISPATQPTVSEKDVFTFLETRRGILDGVCITGGEPTISLGLIPFIKKIKSLGYLVKLDTNGYFPDAIMDLCRMNLLDYIAMDIKSSPAGYANATGLTSVDMSLIEKSIHYIMNASVPYEFRTTVIKEYHDETTMQDIGKLIEGAEAYYLQSFVDSDQVSDHSLHACTKEELLHYQELLTPFVKEVTLRGID